MEYIIFRGGACDGHIGADNRQLPELYGLIEEPELRYAVYARSEEFEYHAANRHRIYTFIEERPYG